MTTANVGRNEALVRLFGGHILFCLALMFPFFGRTITNWLIAGCLCVVAYYVYKPVVSM